MWRPRRDLRRRSVRIRLPGDGLVRDSGAHMYIWSGFPMITCATIGMELACADCSGRANATNCCVLPEVVVRVFLVIPPIVPGFDALDDFMGSTMSTCRSSSPRSSNASRITRSAASTSCCRGTPRRRQRLKLTPDHARAVTPDAYGAPSPATDLFPPWPSPSQLGRPFL